MFTNVNGTPDIFGGGVSHFSGAQHLPLDFDHFGSYRNLSKEAVFEGSTREILTVGVSCWSTC
jgi:hypothetical protein